MIDNHLRVIDFSAAVQSQPLNFDYNVIKGWVDRERLRIGGYGLCEGFDLTYDYKYGVDIGEGCLINHRGEEVMTPQYHIQFDPPPYETITETLTVQDEGILNLKFAPYSPSAKGLITINTATTTQYDQSELQVLEPSTTVHAAGIIGVDGRKLTVSSRMAGQKVDVKYYYCNDRIDAIMIDEDANFSYEQGINSESPSVANINLNGRFLIAFAHWIIKDTIDVEFIIDERTYRRIYVDHYNRLYLNGKLYKEPKFIYFSEPENPEENDVWYDYKSNTLNVWSNQSGVWGWRIINDFTNVPLRTVRLWIPQTDDEKKAGKKPTRYQFPADSQTFLFDDSETNLRYIPGINSIEVIIDQQVVMNDQYTEIVQQGSKPYLSSGIGFKLNQPLDRDTVVECIVHHTVKNAPLKNVFQRAAIFVDENFQTFTTDNKNQIFWTELPYVVNADQLEVFVDGARLNKGTEFQEMMNATTKASDTDKDKTTKCFKVTKTLKANQVVSYKISRYVWSYDQLNVMMEEIEKKADNGLTKCTDLQNQITTMSKNTTDILNSLKTRLDQVEAKVKDMSKYRTMDTKITLNDLTADLKNSLIRSRAQYTYNASNIDNTIPDCKNTDYISIFCANPQDGVTPLIENKEYTMSYSNNQGIINLDASWMSPDNTLYVNVIRIGR